MAKWYEHPSINEDVVISSRVRLARNLSDVSFQDQMTAKDANELVDNIRKCAPLLEEKENQKFYTCNVNKLNELERAAMIEWHVISPLLAEKKQDTGLILSEDESISVMVNEEDHLRIQSVVTGMDINKAFENADRIDDALSEVFKYAFHEKYGYLTTCPTNTGTGLRASYMLFLPMLSMEGKLSQLSDEVSKFNVTIRGIYGEGSKSQGHMYQISNQKTLGSTELDIIRSLDEIVLQIIKQERKRRDYVRSVNELDLADKVYRSYGILKYAKQISGNDAMMLLSQVKLGVDMGILRIKGKSNFHRLMMEIQPASLQKHYGKNIGGGERDHYRAAYINERLPQLLEKNQ